MGVDDESPTGVEGFPQSTQQQQEPPTPQPPTPRPTPINLGKAFEEEKDEIRTPEIPRFQMRGDIYDVDDEEEEEIERDQDGSGKQITREIVYRNENIFITICGFVREIN